MGVDLAMICLCYRVAVDGGLILFRMLAGSVAADLEASLVFP
jgi:hypothetical protein